MPFNRRTGRGERDRATFSVTVGVRNECKPSTCKPPCCRSSRGSPHLTRAGARLMRVRRRTHDRRRSRPLATRAVRSLSLRERAGRPARSSLRIHLRTRIDHKHKVVVHYFFGKNSILPINPCSLDAPYLRPARAARSQQLNVEILCVCGKPLWWGVSGDRDAALHGPPCPTNVL